MNLRWLLKKVAGHFGADTKSLESGSKVPTIAKACAVLCYLGLTSVSIATELGISQSAVSRAIAHAPEKLQREEIKGEWLEYQ
jgi:DNA-directed RNA polymerase specialized sigma subunit